MDKFLKFIADNLQNDKIRKPKDLPHNILPKTEYVYIKALLEAQFSPRIFSLQETEELISEVYPEWYMKHGKSAK